VIRFLFLEGKLRSEIKERLDAVYGDSFLFRWRPSKIGLMSFNVVARRFLMSHAQVPWKLHRALNYLRGWSDKYLASIRKTKILEKWRFICQH